MASTTLNLLTREGALTVTFTPGLTPEQYARLIELAEEHETLNSLSEALLTVARVWGLTATLDAC